MGREDGIRRRETVRYGGKGLYFRQRGQNVCITETAVKGLHKFDDYIDETSISTFNDGSGFIVGYIINE